MFVSNSHKKNINGGKSNIFSDIILQILIPFFFSFVHILDFQNYLRTQTGNNTTVNIVISTVDYLLRVQVGLLR